MKLWSIFAYEWRYCFFSLQNLMVAAFLFGIAFLFTANGIEFQVTARGGNVFANSPYMITNVTMLLSLFSVFCAPGYVGNAVLKDAESRFDAVLFATPIREPIYLLGRFFGSFCALVMVYGMVPLGLYLGTFWPWAVPETLTENHLSHYVTVYGLYLVPTLFAVSAVMFTTALFGRKVIYAYTASLAMLILYLASSVSEVLPPVVDPFLLRTVDQITDFWTAAERNAGLLPWQGPLVWNRGLWILFGVAMLAFALVRFSFRLSQAAGKAKPKEAREPEHTTVPDFSFFREQPQEGKHVLYRQFLLRTRFEIAQVLGAFPFRLMMVFCFFLLIVGVLGRETLYDVKTYPLTRLLIDAVRDSLSLALLAVAAFYSADVFGRERSRRIHEIIDATPVPNGVFVLSKIIALFVVMHGIVLLGLFISLVVQLFEGFHDFRPGLYLGHGLLYHTSTYLFLALLAAFFQVMSRSRTVAVLCFLIFMGVIILAKDVLGLEHILFSYGVPDIGVPLSDMNADSRFGAAGLWLRAYWLGLAGILLMFMFVFWERGTARPWQMRYTQLRQFRAMGFATGTLFFLTLFLGSGAWIYFNTNILNIYRTEKDVEELGLAYEQRFRQYEDLPMPRITEVEMNVDIYPYQRRVVTRSRHLLQNKTEQSLREIHLIFPISARVPLVELEDGKRRLLDEDLNYYIFDLTEPMQPGETLELQFKTIIEQHGFPNSRRDTRLVRNGTFLGNHVLTPTVGFNDGLMIRDRNTRREYGLEPLPRLPKLENPNGRSDNYLRQDSDFIRFKTTVSTVADQIAVAPGYLVGERQEGGRRYFTYEMDAPIMNFYSYLSADYTVREEAHHGVDIQVFYHKDHHYNVDRMITAVKDSLDYYQHAFGPYQYRQMRILEFPAYREFAQSFPNTVPFSEGIGFVADVEDPREIDLPYYVTAHEVAHQWWGHQVMSANCQGGTMISETLAQYGALMVMEKKYGPHQVRKFLKLELERYLEGRAKEPEGELPLYRVENQPYIHYRKGGMVMYALKEYVGEETVNRALSRFVEAYRYQAAPYPVSTDLLTILKEEAGSEHQSLIEDFFEKITIYDTEILSAESTAKPDGTYEVVLKVKHLKYNADPLGVETEVDWDLDADIGIFLKDPNSEEFSDQDVLFLERCELKGKETTITRILDQKPIFAGIDPYHKLIDRDLDNNQTEVTQNPR